uniref:Uncharacterized protein n=1 Tax=Micrurus lemniscatus lemniscatus TaxID=129467 RepID=A0A2D4IVM3_MICLE
MLCNLPVSAKRLGMHWKETEKSSPLNVEHIYFNHQLLNSKNYKHPQHAQSLPGDFKKDIQRTLNYLGPIQALISGTGLALNVLQGLLDLQPKLSPKFLWLSDTFC